MDELLATALAALGRRVEQASSRLDGSHSEASVYRVRIDGGDAVVKVTPAVKDRRRARRELAFLRDLAGTAPIRTPRLLDWADTGEVTALVLAAHTPGPPARDWDRATWLAVARQLAGIHAMPVPEHGSWLGDSWLARTLARPVGPAVAGFWAATTAAAAARRLLADLDTVTQTLRAAVPGFVHGDCHADNLLRDGGELVWIDWQGTGIGSPAGDFALLWHRAVADGADPPRQAMVEEYLRHRPVDRDQFTRLLLAHEIGTTLFGWPDFAALHPPEDRERVARRVADLAQQWFTPAAPQS